MRQLIVQVPHGYGGRVVQIAEQYNALNVFQSPAQVYDEAWDVVYVHVTNNSVDELLQKLEQLPDMRVTLVPQNVFPMSPPTSQVPQSITSVYPRSPTEVWLNGLQSIGSWKGFLGYAAAAAVVVWVGMVTETIFLLVAAMLIAPFAGPAMNVAIASASGDRMLLGRSVARYFTSLLLTIVIAYLLTLVLRVETATTTVESTSVISSYVVLLPLIAGAAGALNLVQSTNSSLVSGTAVGLLVAASLSPPAGLIGIAGAINRWDLAINGVFVLLLQLVGINLGGAIVFRLYGLRPQGARYRHGRSYIFYASMVITLVAMGALLWWQFSNSPALQRSTRAQEALDVATTAVEETQLVTLVEANFRFTRSSRGPKETLLGVVYVQPQDGVQLPDAIISERIQRLIQTRLLEAGFNVEPLISVNVLEGPPSELATGGDQAAGAEP